MTISMFTFNQKAIAVALAAVVLIVGATAYVASRHVGARDRLAELEPRYARLIGIEASAGAIDAALIERRALLARRAYLSSVDVARAGSDAQQRAREIFTKAGLEVSSTQILPAKVVEGFDRIPVVLRVEGDLASLQSAMVVISAQTPSLFIDGFNVQATGMAKADAAQRLAIQVNLVVLRVRQ